MFCCLFHPWLPGRKAFQPFYLALFFKLVPWAWLQCTSCHSNICYTHITHMLPSLPLSVLRVVFLCKVKLYCTHSAGNFCPNHSPFPVSTCPSSFGSQIFPSLWKQLQWFPNPYPSPLTFKSHKEKQLLQVEEGKPCSFSCNKWLCSLV